MIRARSFLVSVISAVALIACSDDSATDTVAEENQSTATVRVAPVERGAIQSWVFGEGTARAVSREFLSFESAGRIAYVDQSLKEGDVVEQGQLIAYQEKNQLLDGHDLDPQALSHVAVRDAQANLELAQQTYDRFSLLLEQRSASQQEYDEAEAQLERARVSYENALLTAEESRIVSPINGVVARLNIEQGYYFTPQQVQSTSEAGALNTVPVVIIDPSRYEITVQLPTFAHSSLAVGNPVLIQSGETAGRAASSPPQANSERLPAAYATQGVIYAISPSIDPSTRTFAVKIRTTEGEENLQDGEFVTAWLGGLRAEDTLTLPLNAVRYDNGSPFVFAFDPSTSTVSRADVSLGLQGTERQQVLSGLDAGMQVVTEGRSGLSDGDRVRLASAAAGGT